jgi:hypothetical protein
MQTLSERIAHLEGESVKCRRVAEVMPDRHQRLYWSRLADDYAGEAAIAKGQLNPDRAAMAAE